MPDLLPTERSIFLSAIERRSTADRATYVQEACGADHHLRAAVEELLAAHDRLDQAAPAANASTADHPLPDGPAASIGPYKLLEQIGEGGFGVVYLAEQTSPVRRRVALKVLKAGMDTRRVVARFEAERQALAIMDHPNIARVFDGGETPAGRPYFVMELVKGVPITDFCDQNHLTPRQRLELFLPVCQAVQHAHQKGVIHRDLKPSNVLVSRHDTSPVVKVIDFGIAKALGQELTEKTLFTGAAQMVGTPLYMSPEQAGMSDLDVDTRSDVYSLGVVLYELLTGTTPFDKDRMRAAGYDEIRRILREEDPPKPSTRISTLGRAASTVSADRRSDSRRLSRLFRGDPDWVIMKCLEKDRTRRYEAASDLARDIERYLSDEPVEARPPSAGYRLRKFARRHKGGLAAAALVLFFLVLLGGGVGWALSDRSARQAKVAGQIELILADVDRLMKEQNWPEALAAARRAEAVVVGGEADEVTAQRVRNLLKDLEFVDRLEQIRMRPATISDGQHASAGAVREYAQAFRGFGVDVEELPVEASIDRLKARPALTMPLAAALDDWAFRRRWAFDGDADGWKLLVAVARGIDPDPLRDRLRAAWAQPVAEREDELLRQLADSIDLRAQLPATLRCLTSILRQPKNLDHAVRILRGALAVYPGDFWFNRDLGNVLYQRKDYEGAIRFYTAAVSIRPYSAGAHYNLGIALRHQKKLDEAVAEHRTAIQLDPGYSYVHSGLGNALRDQNKPHEAIAEYHTAIKLDPKNTDAHSGLGLALQGQKKLDEAASEFRTAIRLNPKDPVAHINLGSVLVDQNKLDEAIAEHRKAIELDPQDAAAHRSLGDALHDQDKPDEAIAEYRTAIAIDPKDVDAHNNLGVVLYDQKKPNEAAAEFRTVVRLDPNDAAAHFNLGNALRDQENLDEAIAEYRTAIRRGLKHAGCHLNLANALRGQKKPGEAIAEYRKAIELDPKYCDAHVALGATLDDQNKLDEAIAEHREAIRLRPDSAVAHGNLSVTLNKKGLLDESIAAAREAIRLQPDYADAHYNLSNALTPKGLLDEAVAAAREAIRLKPSYVDAHIGLGNALDAQKRLDEAIAEYRVAIRLQPDDPLTHFNLGNTLRRKGLLDEAIGSYREAIRLQPDHRMAHDSLGRVFMKKKRADEAIAEFKEAVRLQPDCARFHANLADAFRRKGLPDEAASEFKEAVRLKPDDGVALNGWAWHLANCADPKCRDPKQAVGHAQRAVDIVPAHGGHRLTLGAAHYRAGQFKDAVADIEQAMKLDQGGSSVHWFFLAMAHWKLGEKAEARRWYDKAVAWMNQDEPDEPDRGELIRFRAEASELLGVAGQGGTDIGPPPREVKK